MREFSLQVQARWSDIDQLGHANNIAYWRWCEDVRHLQAEAVGLGSPSPNKPSQILVASEAEYLAPIFLHDSLKVVCQTLEIGWTSQKASYHIIRDDLLMFRAHCTLVLFDGADGAAVPYPDVIGNKLLGGEAGD